ncbi:MAG TPA: aminotransferase class I/II-fold pyridoxal phosphate-dependent enzyme, partial [Euryarchaeota archaeon]|nr:aminotransferase class I/II-fold pyridoxal phosphate-dependent enzyme [Euryarchaeota archaeon]
MHILEKPIHGDDSYLHPEAIDFSSNVSPLGPGDRVIKAIEENAGNIFRYPSGGEKLRGIIAERHELKQENIALGNGSSELIKNFCEAFIDRGERVLIAGPTFSEYDYFSRLRGAEVQYTGLPENLVVDAGAFTENNF